MPFLDLGPLGTKSLAGVEAKGAGCTWLSEQLPCRRKKRTDAWRRSGALKRSGSGWRRNAESGSCRRLPAVNSATRNSTDQLDPRG